MTPAVFALIMTITGPQGVDTFTLGDKLTMIECHEDFLEAANNTVNDNIAFVCKVEK